MSKPKVRHIEMNGKPLCCVHHTEFGNMDRMFTIEDAVLERGGMMVCMPDPSQIDVTVQAMRSFGLDAHVVDGVCPEYGRVDEWAWFDDNANTTLQ